MQSFCPFAHHPHHAAEPHHRGPYFVLLGQRCWKWCPECDVPACACKRSESTRRIRECGGSSGRFWEAGALAAEHAPSTAPRRRCTLQPVWRAGAQRSAEDAVGRRWLWSWYRAARQQGSAHSRSARRCSSTRNVQKRRMCISCGKISISRNAVRAMAVKHAM